MYRMCSRLVCMLGTLAVSWMQTYVSSLAGYKNNCVNYNTVNNVWVSLFAYSSTSYFRQYYVKPECACVSEHLCVFCGFIITATSPHSSMN